MMKLVLIVVVESGIYFNENQFVIIKTNANWLVRLQRNQLADIIGSAWLAISSSTAIVQTINFGIGYYKQVRHDRLISHRRQR